jgi:hypothetical protein
MTKGISGIIAYPIYHYILSLIGGVPLASSVHYYGIFYVFTNNRLFAGLL